ncbi:MAG: XdhC family protein [Proteobacteria bacterium]|nr:XdhC family protein [Pseudomonadota bacterium]MCH8189122.1 XdhC family protein [Pseudomonadota bacterium]
MSKDLNREATTSEATNHEATTGEDWDNVLEQAARWKAAGKGVALATVVATWGSSPRPVGSQLAVDDAGGFVGSVSGGCIEGAVVQEALETIADGKVRLLDYGVTNSQAWEVGLTCGGKVQVFVERLE